MVSHARPKQESPVPHLALHLGVISPGRIRITAVRRSVWILVCGCLMARQVHFAPVRVGSPARTIIGPVPDLQVPPPLRRVHRRRTLLVTVCQNARSCPAPPVRNSTAPVGVNRESERAWLVHRPRHDESSIQRKQRKCAIDVRGPA